VSATVFYADPSAELATLTNTFDVNGVPTDPTTVTLTITDPTGTQTTPANSKVSTGVYTADVATTLDGIWLYKWTGTGSASDVVEGTFTVTTIDSRLYVTVEELKSRLGITVSTFDFELILSVQAASSSVDEITGRYFWRGTDTRTYVPESYYRQSIDDLVSVTSLKADRDGDGVFEETWTLGTDYQLEVSPGRFNTASKGELWPYTGFNIIGPKFIPVVWPWSHLDRLQVTGVFGWPAVPRNVKQAALIIAAELFKLKEAPFGVAGFPELGTVKITSNPQVLWLLHRYISGDRVGV